MPSRTRTIALILALAALAGAGPAFADPPARVGRLSLMSGTVTFAPEGEASWSPAVLNYPLTTGDTVWTDHDGRAEIHVGSTALRLDADTDLSFQNLDDSTLQASLTQGTVSLRVRELSAEEAIEIDTPDASITLRSPGLYRIDVPGGSYTELAVRSGEAEIGTGRSSINVTAGQYARVRGAGTVNITLGPLPPEDPWDAWCRTRDREEEGLVSARYVPRDLPGCEDLDRYGTWEVTVRYGPVWIPRGVGSHWAPYRDGHWVWVSPWGWTWIDDAPWGFAPFHYGRWASFEGRWVWVPGVFVSRPVYAPALVVFIGGDAWNISVTVESGIGWFPLAPHEPYFPPFTASNSYVRRINESHVKDFDPRAAHESSLNYTHRKNPAAVTVIRDRDFTSAKPVARSTVNVSERELQSAPLRGTLAPAAPKRESTAGRQVPEGRAVAKPPEPVKDRPVVKRLTPPQRQAPPEQRQGPVTQNGRAADAQPQNRGENAPRTSSQDTGARTQAVSLIGSVRGQLEAAQRRVSAAQRSSPNAQAASNLLAEARRLLAEADRDVASGNYASAVQKANAASADIGRANSMIAASPEKVPQKRKK